MKLKHITNITSGSTITTIVVGPLAIVNYLNSHIDEICASSLKTEPVAETDKLRSIIPIISGEAIVITGHPNDVLPVLSWLKEASSAHSDYLKSIKSIE